MGQATLYVYGDTLLPISDYLGQFEFHYVAQNISLRQRAVCCPARSTGSVTNYKFRCLMPISLLHAFRHCLHT
jgi:hypothetical protein